MTLFLLKQLKRQVKQPVSALSQDSRQPMTALELEKKQPVVGFVELDLQDFIKLVIVGFIWT